MLHTTKGKIDTNKTVLVTDIFLYQIAQTIDKLLSLGKLKGSVKEARMFVIALDNPRKTTIFRKLSEQSITRVATTKCFKLLRNVFRLKSKSTFFSMVATLVLLLFITISEKSELVSGQVVMGGNMNGKITKEVVCHACGATIKEINKALSLKAGSKRPEADVMDVMSDICKMDSFKIYDYPPPKMIRACQKVLDRSDELLEKLFLQKPHLSVEEIEEVGCKESCRGVDKTKKTSTNMGAGGTVEPDVFVDGVPQSFGSSMPNEGGSNIKPTKKRNKKKRKKKKKKKNRKKKTKRDKNEEL